MCRGSTKILIKPENLLSICIVETQFSLQQIRTLFWRK